MSNQITQQDIESYFKVVKEAQRIANKIVVEGGFHCYAHEFQIAHNGEVRFNVGYSHELGGEESFSLSSILDEKAAISEWKENRDKREKEKREAEKKANDDLRRLEASPDVIEYKELTKSKFYSMPSYLPLTYPASSC